MINSHKQNGSALIISVIILTVTILGALGYVAWNNFFTTEGKAPKERTTTQPEATSAEKPITEDRGYLVLEDWGIKFKLPENAGDVHYYKVQTKNENGTFDYYEFSTARVEALGQACIEPNSEGIVTRLATLSRGKNDQKDNPHAGIFVNNNQPLGGYYYYAGGAQSMCAEKGGDIQGNDRNLLVEMLKNPISI